MGAEHRDKVSGRPIRRRGGREAIVRSRREGQLGQLAEWKSDEFYEQTQEQEELGQHAAAASIAADACVGIAPGRG